MGGKKITFPTNTTRGTKKSVSFKKAVILVKKKFFLQSGISPAEGFIGIIILKLLAVSSAIIHWDFVRQEKTAEFCSCLTLKATSNKCGIKVRIISNNIICQFK